MGPADALDRVVYLLDRALAEGRRVAAYGKARDLVRELGDDVVAQHHADGTLLDLPGIGPSTGKVIALALDGGIDDYLAKLEDETAIDIGEGAELRAALRGDCHSHTTWSDGGAATAVMARTAQDLGHEYLVVTDHSPRLTIAHGLNRERLLQQLDEIEQLNEQLAPFRILTGMEVDINEDGSLDQDDDLLERLDVVVASVHSKLRMPEADMTRRMVMAVASPHVDILGHCTGRKVVGQRSTPEPVRRRHRVRRLRAVRHRRRDQLPPRAPGSARGAAGAGARLGLPHLHRHRRPCAGPARVAGLRLRQGRQDGDRARAHHQHDARRRPHRLDQDPPNRLTTQRLWSISSA